MGFWVQDSVVCQPARNRLVPFRRLRSIFIIVATLTIVVIRLSMFGKWLRKSTLWTSYQGERGFTLIEVLLSVVIISTIGIAVIKAIDSNARAIRTLDEKAQAVNLATAFLENIRQLNYDNDDTPYADAGGNIAIPYQYNVEVSVQYSDNGTNWVATHTNEKLQKITATVLREGRLIFSACTLRAER